MNLELPKGTRFWRLDSGRGIAWLPNGDCFQDDGVKLSPRAAAGLGSLLGDAETITEEEFRKASATEACLPPTDTPSRQPRKSFLESLDGLLESYKDHPEDWLKDLKKLEEERDRRMGRL